MIETSLESIELRSPPVIEPSTPVDEAAEYLRQPDVPAVPVAEDGDIVGVVTDSDLVALVAETDERPPTREVMSSPVETVTPSVTLREAADRMRESGVKQLPVVARGDYRGLVDVETLAPFLSRSALEIEWQDEPLRIDPSAGRRAASSD